ncbi:MAG: UDP-N-acetylmuramoyl-tripeptide--D-alanyl-D-alanine ligase [Candidatus Omnitrophica bacterium]|nr:UDP-N-acetylmuramoyl-tripeptide--D-alanyl-D-alanine ligase [Candidatus Omnitrophota bacterium]MBU4478007.1 UDP-N-acetylmuramoyl-tripeptide--D-alanyl-D-alanine ligase [Candidatus Omnitrophota bacterium]MCG2703940.1 UDP-N-acetylmuramoyl-tripeptide--D-alanyl-D-alanine ligase [Candidatus Omnitrophota bacterium]
MFTIGEIVDCCAGVLVKGDTEARISAVSIDSRTIRPGELFLAIKGSRCNGHEYIPAVIERKPAGIVVCREWFDNNREKLDNVCVPLIVAEDTVIALGDIAAAHRKKFDIPVIAVTGSNGKTTTKEIIATVLGLQYNVLKNEGSLNNHIGVPLTLLKLNSSHTAAVLELGMNHKGEIRSLAALVRPTIAVITNAAEAHLEFFNGVGDIIDAKCELLENLPYGAHAVVNADYPRLYAKAQEYAEDVIGFGIEKNCRYRASNVISQDDGVVFTLNEKYAFKLPLLGEHNAYNALAAIAVADFLGIAMETMRECLARFQPVSLRMETVNCNGVRIIADCYNANPHSMAAAIRTLTAVANTARKIVVFGDMRELGAASVEQHCHIGQLIAGQGIAFLLTVGKDAAYAAKAAADSGMDKKNIFVFSQTDEASQCLAGLVQPGDVVLLKASRAMKMEQVLKHIVDKSEG